MEKLINYLIDKIEKKYMFALVDIGARSGIQNKWNILKNNLKVIGFEPDQEEYKNLKQTENIRYFDYALYSDTRDLEYKLTRNPNSSTILTPNINFFLQYQKEEEYDAKIEKKIKIPKEKVKRLDDILKENSEKDIDFIKIDTEGSELYIMQGGTNTIDFCFGMQVEVSFTEQQIGQPLFREVDKFLLNKGFVLMDIKRNFWKRVNRYKLGKYKGKGQIIFADVLYFKNIDYFLKSLETNIENKEYIKIKVLKAILTALVYKYFDYAEDIAQKALQKKYINENEYVFIFSKIKKIVNKRRFFNFPGRNFLLRVCSKLTFILGKETSMIDCDNMIGNVLDN